MQQHPDDYTLVPTQNPMEHLEDERRVSASVDDNLNAVGSDANEGSFLPDCQQNTDMISGKFETASEESKSELPPGAIPGGRGTGWIKPGANPGNKGGPGRMPSEYRQLARMGWDLAREKLIKLIESDLDSNAADAKPLSVRDLCEAMKCLGGTGVGFPTQIEDASQPALTAEEKRQAILAYLRKEAASGESSLHSEVSA